MFLKKAPVFLLLTALLLLSACGTSSTAENNEGQQEKGKEKEEKEKVEKIEEITFVDPGWESIKIHNAIAQTIIENGYGYDTNQIVSSETIGFKALTTGDINVYMEIWTGNITKKYNEALKNNEFVELGVNYDDNKQGFYVPTYVIEGDSERGIEPMAPELESVKDLLKYPELFNGKVYGAVTGWTADPVMQEKMESYGLNEKYEYVTTGSTVGLNGSIKAAIDKKEAWVGYNWEPSFITGKYDMTLLKEPKYTKERWENGKRAAFDSQRLTIAVNKEFPGKAPKVTKFLKQYETSSDLTSTAQAYMRDNDLSPRETAHWWLRQHKDLWTKWVPEDVKDKVLSAIQK